LLAILASVWWVTSATLWPGAASIVPVVGTAVMIAGGTLSASKGYDLLTDHPIVQWIGLISFSLYLVHWPIFAIATEYSSHSLSWGVNLLFVALSIALAAILYFSVESPLRRQPLLVRHRALTYAMGVALIGLTYSAIYWHLAHYG
jgi:peptidoglycan/LPS O-acetylase OafA/YrhL